MLTHQLFRHQILGLAVLIQAAKVEKRHAKLFGRNLGKLSAFNQLVLHQVGNQRGFIALSLALRLLGTLFI